MPKILENVRERVLAEAKRQALEKGYTKTTIRSVAKACNLGVGTVYNYFSSKDMLIASFMLEDWQKMLCEIRKDAEETTEKVLYKVYMELRRFSDTYQSLFTDRAAAKTFAAVYAERHPQLLEQLATAIKPICKKNGRAQDPFFAEFVADALLTWSGAGKSFSELYRVLQFLFK